MSSTMPVPNVPGPVCATVVYASWSVIHHAAIGQSFALKPMASAAVHTLHRQIELSALISNDSPNSAHLPMRE